MRRAARRLRAAMRTNEIQAQTVLLLTILNLVAASKNPNMQAPWFYIAAAYFWPLVAFLGNLVSPIPAEHEAATAATCAQEDRQP